MTFFLNVRYPDRVNAPSDDYPRGSFKNRSSPNSDDGTYLEEDWKNDERAFPEAILKNAGVTPNGSVDTANNSQVYDALISIVNKMIATGSATLFGKATGSSDALSVTLNRSISLADGVVAYVRAQYANLTTAPTINVNRTGARAIVKGNNLPLSMGDIVGAGYIMHLAFDVNFNRWVLLNPATGVVVPESIPVGTLAYMARTGDIDGWLFVDGREHQRSQYARFIQACPQFIMNGSSSETFRLIDLRGYFLRTLDSGKGVDVNRKFGSLQGDAQRPVKGTVYGYEMNRAGTLVTTGAFYDAGAAPVDGTSGSKHAGAIIGFDSSRDTVTAGENRPKNYAFPLYVKV